MLRPSAKITKKTPAENRRGSMALLLYSILVEDNLNTAVLRFADARAGRDQQMRFAISMNFDLGAWDTIRYELSRDSFSTALRKTLVIDRRT